MRYCLPIIVAILFLTIGTAVAVTPPPPPPVVGSPANGLAISGHTLTLGPASDTQPGAMTTGSQLIGGQKTFVAPPLAPDGTNLFRFVMTSQNPVTLHTGDVYSDVHGFNYTVVTGGTGVTTFTVTSPSGAPNQFYEQWTKVSGNAGSTSPFFIIYYVDNVTPSLAFANDPTSGIVRFGANDWGLVFNGQTVFEAKTATVAGIPGTDISIGTRQAAAVDADGVFSVTGNYIDYAAFTFSNANITSPSTGAVVLVCDGGNGEQCTTLENFASNTENDPYLQGVGALFAGAQNPSGLIVGSENNCYDFVLSSAVQLNQAAVYSDSDGTQFSVENVNQQLTSVNQRFCTTSATYSLNPSQASGTLTCISGCSGNLTYNSWTAEAFVALTAGSRYHQNEVLRATSTGIITNQIISTSGGSGLSNPAIQFGVGANGGIAFTGPYDVSIVSNGHRGIDVNGIGQGGAPNIGINQAASSSTTVPLQATYAVNGNATYTFANTSQSSASATSILVLNGTSIIGTSGIRNEAWGTDTYIGGSTTFFADGNSNNVIIASENPTGNILFNVGSTIASSTQRLAITPSKVQTQNSVHFDANSTTINNVADPGSAQDAMTLNYAGGHYQAGPLTGDVTTPAVGTATTSVAKIHGTTVSGTTGSVNVVFSTSASMTTPTITTPTFLTSALFPDGASISAPGIAFSSDTQTGLMRTGASNPTLVAGGQTLIDSKVISTSPLQVNVGIGQAAVGTADTPLAATTAYNGQANFIFQNSSTAGGTVKTNLVARGGNSTTGDVGILNAEFSNVGYYGGYGLFYTDNQGLGTIIASEYASGVILFTTGGTPAANKERMQINNTSIIMEELVQLPVQGSGVTPSCSASGLVAITHAYIMCVCNGTTWVKTADGSTTCTF